MELNHQESSLLCSSADIVYLNEEDPKKAHNNIKLFKIELSIYENIIEVLLKILSPTEVQRAERYLHLRDRNRFIICRSILKHILAKETSVEISKIAFEKSSNHKPYLPLDPLLFFNVSHAGNYAVIAIGNCELGVDIEFIDHKFDFSEILPNVFGDSEINHISNAKSSILSFYKLWTRKEAIVKSIGKGINDDFIKIPVSDGLHNVPSELMGNYSHVNAFSFDLNEEYVGTLALTENMILKNILCYPLPSPNELKFFILNQLK